MPAVWLRARAELRRRWRAWIGLGLLLGFSVGVVAAVAVGARRTSTAVPRFHRELAGWDAYVENNSDAGIATFDPADIEALPMVVSSARARLDYVGPTGDAVLYTGPDEGFGTALERAKLLTGRLPDPRRADEVTIATGSEQALGAHVGDRFQLHDPAELDPPLRRLFPVSTVRVVGVVAMPNMVGLPRGIAPGGVLFGTPPLHDELKVTTDALAELHPEEASKQSDGVMVKLRRGGADVAAFRQALERMATHGVVQVQRSADITVNLSRSIHLQAVTLWLLALLLGVVGLASIVATMRQSAGIDIGDDASTLRALGMTRVEMHALAALRGLVIGAAGAVVTTAVAVGLSSRMLFGLARVIEPNEGTTVDWTVLVIALAAVIVLGVTGAAVGGALARRASASRRSPVVRIPSATSVPGGVGVRFACSGWSLLGRGIAGPAIGIAALAGALVFGASLSHLRSVPALYGWRWDVVATNYGSVGDGTDPGGDKGIATLQAIPGVTGMAVGNSVEAHVRGKPLFVITLDVVRGDASEVLPPIVQGEAPVGPGQIALASRTMHRLGAHIGDRIDMTVDGGARAATATVVGRIVIPPVLGTVEPGDGALMPNRTTFAAFGVTPSRENVAADSVYAQVAPGGDASAVLAAINKGLGGSFSPLYEVPRVQPRDLVDFGRVDGFPLLLGGVLAVLAASTLLHVLVSSVRLRRHDLATLRALGLRRGQLGGVILSQATFLVLLAGAVGVPLGIAVGRTAWSVYARRSGFISVVRVPVFALLLVGVIAIVVAEMCAAVPAHIAARTRPAQLLRSE
jgi:ABC-type lipoprotein release transport system permease subunit